MREQGDAPNPHPLALELRSIRPPIFTAFPVHLDRQRLRAGNRGRWAKNMKTTFRLTLLFLLAISIPLIAGETTYSVPSILQLSYPQSFEPDRSQEREARLNEAITMLSRSGVKPSIGANEMLDLLILKSKDKEYAHISITAFPPEATQEDIKAANQELLDTLAKGLEQNIRAGYRGNGMAVTTGFTGRRLTLTDGSVAFLLEHVYKMPDGRIRTNQKYYVYTSRFTLVVGITASPDITAATRSEIETVVRSLTVSR